MMSKHMPRNNFRATPSTQTSEIPVPYLSTLRSEREQNAEDREIINRPPSPADRQPGNLGRSPHVRRRLFADEHPSTPYARAAGSSDQRWSQEIDRQRSQPSHEEIMATLRGFR